MIQLRDKESCRYDCLSLGEIMLRLDPAEGRIRGARRFDVWAGGGEYNGGETVTLTAVPDSGYRFAGWTVTGASVADLTAATITFTMPRVGNVTALASFVPVNSSGGSGSGSTGSNSDDLAAKINDLEKSYDQKLQELKNTYTNKSEAQSAEYERKLAAMKADYEKQLAELKKPAPTPKPSTPMLPDNTGAIEDNTAAILAANEKLAEMVRQANALVLSDNMAVSRSVAASGTAQIAAAANNYHRDGDTNIVQNIYSKAQTAADLARETRWEADRAKATKH